MIWASILGAAPFSLLMPHATLAWTIILSFCVGLMLSSAFPAILLYAQELLPTKLGLISGLFFGFAFGVAGIASAVLGNMADKFGIESDTGIKKRPVCIVTTYTGLQVKVKVKKLRELFIS